MEPNGKSRLQIAVSRSYSTPLGASAGGSSSKVNALLLYSIIKAHQYYSIMPKN